MRRRQSLGHSDRDRARAQADEIAAGFLTGESRDADITIGELFDIYLREMTPSKGTRKQEHDRRAAKLLGWSLGRDREASSVSIIDLDRFVAQRRNGDCPGTTGPVRDRIVGYDLSWLRAVFNWGMRAAVGGRPLVARNPLKGYRLPKERNPNRPVITETQYQVLLRTAGQVDWRMRLMLVLANETGHRLGAIRHLRWSDIELERARIHWRAEHDKIGHQHVTPISAHLVGVLSQVQRNRAAIGDAWVLPAPRDPGKPCPKGTLDKWFTKTAELTGLELPRGARWHALRRKFATEMRHMSLKELCLLGGWKDPKTLLECYQHPDEDALRAALQARQPLGVDPFTVSSEALNGQ